MLIAVSTYLRIVPRVGLDGVAGRRRATRRLVLLAALALVTGCATFGQKFVKPELTLAGIEVLGGNLLQQNLRLTLNIHNPNARALPVRALRADLQVGGETIAHGASSGAFVVPANGDASCDLLVTTNMALGLLKLANASQQSGSIEYDLSGVAEIDLPFVGALPFHQHGSYSLTK